MFVPSLYNYVRLISLFRVHSETLVNFIMLSVKFYATSLSKCPKSQQQHFDK